MTSLGVIEMVYPASHENEWMAGLLKKELSSYRIPAAVQKKTGIRKLSEVDTPALIVFCMPESIKDPEVEAAIERFRKAGLSKRIIALILGGPPGERFPEGLLHETLPDGTVVDREPLAANISAPTRKGMLKKLETEKLRIIASVLGVAFDDLKNRRRRQRMRIAAAAGAVLALFSLAYLGYAFSRVRAMRTQQEELSGQYIQAQAAESEAEIQRNTAKEAFAGTVAYEAREVLEEGDSELALLLCLELLPEMRNADPLTEVFRDILEVLCAEGYVPVTERAAYTRSRYQVNPNKLNPPEDPEGEYSLRDLTGNLLRLENRVLLNDGTLIGVGTGDNLAYRVRIDDGAVLPFFDGETESPLVTGSLEVKESGGVSLPHPVTAFQHFEGMDVVFGNSKGAVEVYSVAPFRYLETLEGFSALTDQKGTDFLLGDAETELRIYTKKPFAVCCTLPAEKDRLYLTPEVMELPDGRVITTYCGNIYQLPEGTVLYSFFKGDFGGLERFEELLSPEGWLPMKVRDRLVFFDISSGKVRGSIPFPNGNNIGNGYYGPYDEKRHRRSAAAYHMLGLVWEYRETAIEVPEDLEGQIALAERFLQGRVLKKKERVQYHLD